VKRFSFWLLASTLALSLKVYAQDSLHVTIVGRLESNWDSVRDVAVRDSYAYLATCNTGLYIVDISDPANLSEVGLYDTPGVAYGIAVAGDYAYIADYSSGICILDISDPPNPLLMSTYNTPGAAYNLTVSDNHAFIATGSGGLSIINVSDPSHPVETGFYDTPGLAYAVALSGDLAIVADGGTGILILDISHLADPLLIGLYDTPGSAYGVAISGDYATVADKASGLRIVDLSNPANPIETGFYDTPGEAREVMVAGNHAFVADYNGGLRIIDLIDPTTPLETGFYDTPQFARGVAPVIPLVYLANYRYFEVYNCSNAIDNQLPRTMTIPLQANYFELISTNLLPENLDAAMVFGGINGLRIVYQNDGCIYLPGVINTIHEISVNQGYQVFTNLASELTIEGRLLSPDTEYTISRNRWNWIGFPYDTPVPVQVALAEIEGAYRIVQTDDGRLWIPAIPLNTLGEMQPGEGYMIFPIEDATFRFRFEE